MGSINGQFRSVDRSTMHALRQAADSGNKIEAHEIDTIEKAAALDGKITEGEKI